jgi:tetraacyldisaccharide 4'-kinase
VKPLSALYGAAVRIRNDLYDRGMLPVNRLEAPVLSIGNLAVGGAGKTPFLILLGELLQRRGIAFDVLSRGYRRETEGVAIVDPNGSAADFGDEPLLIARKLGVHVIVGEDRRQAGEMAEATFGPQLHLLDDGFQHRGLARDFDIVLITPTDAEDSLLPTGRLREPIASLARADAVVLTNDSSADGLPLQKQLVWHVHRDIVPPETLEPWFAFCGIARPENFFAQLEAAQVVLAGTRSFRDHHRYSDEDVRTLQRLRQQAGAPAFVTTEKDAVNLGSHLQVLQPIHVARVRMELEEADTALDAMLAALAERKRHTT